MTKLQDWDALSVGILDMAKHHVKFTILEDLVGKEKMPKLLDYAQNIIEAMPVFMDLGEKDLKLATALTSKPYYFKQWSY
jgi:hypothetical protein